MKVEQGTIHEQFDRDTFWVRVGFSSDDGERNTTLIACASHEYLWDRFKTNKFTKTDIETKWLSPLIQEFSSKGDQIFNENIHYHVDATTEEGRRNGEEFLKREIKP